MKNIKFNAGAEQPTVAKRGSGGAADNVQWVVSEVVWAAARGHGVPVPWRLSRLTRYLQDTLQPTGACWDSRDTAGSHPPGPNCPASASKWSGAKPQCLRLAPLTHLPQEYDCAMLAEVHGTFLWPRLAIKMQTQW